MAQGMVEGNKGDKGDSKGYEQLLIVTKQLLTVTVTISNNEV